jgi:integrase
LVAENVVLRAEAPSVPLGEIVAPEREVVQAHLEILQCSDPDLELALVLSATLGLRRSELAGLRWSHVDLDKGILRLREGITHVPGTGFTTTTTKTGVHGQADYELHELHLDRLRRQRLESTAKLIMNCMSFILIDSDYKDRSLRTVLVSQMSS